MQKDLPDSVIITIINRKPDIVLRLPRDTVMSLAKSKPWLVGQFSMTALLMLAMQQEIILTLSDRDLANLLAFQPGLISVLANLPEEDVIKFLRIHTNLLDIIPPSAKPHLRRLLQQRDLIRALPMDLLMEVARKESIQELLDKYLILDILEAHPDFILRVDVDLLTNFVKFLADAWFRERLPCRTVRLATYRLDMLDIIPRHILAMLVNCQHIVACVEKSDLIRLAASPDLADRLRLSTMMRAMRHLRFSQLSLQAAINFMQNQVPMTDPWLSMVESYA